MSLEKFNRHYYFARLSSFIRYTARYLKKGDAILVYQMGKVGSSTILRLLQKNTINNPLFHIHVLTKNGIEFEEKAYSIDKKSLLTKSYFGKAAHLYESYFLFFVLKNRIKRKKWRIISIVRDPIDRNISAFFQTLNYRIPNYMKLYNNNSINESDLTYLFLEEFSGKYEQYDLPYEWFVKELNAALKIDIFRNDFNKEKGYSIYEYNEYSLLIIKLEMLNSIIKQALKEFLNLNFIKLIESQNVADQKTYKNIYKKFKHRIKLPAQYVEKMYNDERFRHFYTDSEILMFKKRWKCK